MARKKKHTVNFDDVGKSFKADEEVMVVVEECTLEDGANAPYLSFKLTGTEDYKGAVMYHNASFAVKALFMTLPVFEAFGIDVPEGDFSPTQKLADQFVGKYAMASTYKDRYDGKTSIKAEDFWASDDAPEGGEGEAVEFDLDDCEDDDIKALAKKLKIKGKVVKKLKAALEEADEEDLIEAADALGLIPEEGSGDGDNEGGGEELDLDELDDDDIKALAKAAGIKGRSVKKLKAALEELDEDELEEAAEEAGISGSENGEEGDGASAVTEEAIQEMNQDELEALVEEHDLEVGLDDFKTLRKKKTAVIDAAEEADILEE